MASRSIPRAILLLSIGLLWLGCSSERSVEDAAPATPPDTSFTLAMVPDTQNYVSYDHQKDQGYPFDSVEQLFEQMRYLQANLESAGGDIAFVTQVGDVWNHPSIPMDPEHEARGFKSVPSPFIDRLFSPTELTRTYEMPNARKAFEILSGKVPFSVVPGNHDYDALWNDSRYPPKPGGTNPDDMGQSHHGGLDNFREVFGADTAFFKDRPWYVASHDGGADSAQIFEAGGYRFLHIGLQFTPSDRTLEWAASVIEQHSGLPTIVSTHDHLNTAGEQLPFPAVDEERVDPEDDNSPASVWKKLLTRHDAIFLVLSGHQPGQSRRVDRNDFGHEVHQILADYQMRLQTVRDAGYEPDIPAGIGDGWLRLLTFDMAAPTPTIRVKTYSTHYKKFSGEIPEYASWYRGVEQPGMTDAEFLAAEDFVLELPDFRERFDRTAKVTAAD